ncbi:MAG TPA: alcohol dehydrogenase [Rubrivivax sp.]|nr:alcohol dehydrogenase [Rubrivivax sp.]
MLSWQIEEFGKPLAQAIRDTPQPQGSEVLLRVGACGVCHSDVHLHDGYFLLGDNQRLDLSRGIAPPRTLGHEIVGSVVAFGPDAQGVAVGDTRVVFPWIGCGRCGLCQSGNEHLCNAPQGLGVQRDGGFADHVLVPHPRYLLSFDPLPPEQACTLACAGLTAYSALRKAGSLGAAARLLIIGAGGVGLSGIRLARKLFEHPLIVAEIDLTKWDLARDAGAGDVIDPSAPDAVKSLMKATGGGVAVAIDFVGAAATFAFGLATLRKAGKLVSVGLFGGGTQVMPALVALKALNICGSYVGSLQEMHELLAIARAGTLPPLPVTTQPLANVTQVLADLKAGQVRGRSVLIP